MARERDHFATAHAALAAYAGAGRFGWGRPLAATTLAAELGLSPTPVREALAHLAGEGVIEHHSGRGYFAPSLTASDIVGLYDLHAQYLRWALERSPQPISILKHACSSPVSRVEEVFTQLIRRGGSEAMHDAHRRVTAQLRPVRRVEDLLGDAGLAVVDQIEQMADAGESHHAARLADRYHLDRAAMAPTIESMMRQSE